MYHGFLFCDVFFCPSDCSLHAKCYTEKWTQTNLVTKPKSETFFSVCKQHIFCCDPCHRVLFCILMWSNLVKWDFFAPVLFIQYRWYGRVSFHIITNIIYSSAICVSIRTLTLFIRFIVFTVSAAPYRFLFGIFFPFSLSIWTKLSMKKSLGHWPVFALVE